MKKHLKKIALITGMVLLGGIFIHAVSHEKISDKIYNGPTKFYPTEMSFAGERTPLEIPDVRERFERELLVNANLHASTLLIIKRANREFKIIEPILKKYNVPDDFKYLAVAESALQNVVSAAGARGVWQFMPKTAQEYGMEVTDEVDERYHLAKSTEAACKYLLSVKEKLGSWTLAAAAYNGGLNGVSKQIDFQGETNYYNLLLTEETHRYVFRILALKEIMEHPERYFFKTEPAELYQPIPSKMVIVDSTVTNFANFARSQGINYKELKYHNPWLRDRKLTNKSKKQYEIVIPVK